MSTKYDARQRKELKEWRERTGRKEARPPQMSAHDRISYAVGYFGILVLAGLVAVAVCLIAGVAP